MLYFSPIFFSYRENENGEVWYYTTVLQLEELLKVLDANDMESALCRELQEYKEEIARQMELTEKLTNQFKGNKKTYLDTENALIIKKNKEVEEKQEEERKERERQNAEDMVAKLHEEPSDAIVNTESTTTTTTPENDTSKPELQNENSQNGDDDSDPEKKDIVTRSKTGSLTPRTFNIDDLRKRTTAVLNREDGDKEAPRMTRLKSSQMANGTYLYKLGMENNFKTYVNQYTTNVIALNKPQRNEERDKKRHLSHKFSLTTASEFKWTGGVSGNKTLLLNTVRQTILQLEQAIQSPFMHPNWPLIRKQWLSAVSACQHPKDLARTLIILQACIKSVVFANVWHEQLGHIKLSRITAAEREERKKIEKREKKEREEEEERNRTIISGYVKYTMVFKHQLWKQKGEEYRIHGRWGWLWLSSARILRHVNSRELGLAAGPHKVMVQVKTNAGEKILAVEPSMFAFLNRKFKKDDGNGEMDEVDDAAGGDTKKNDESKFFKNCSYL